jgi:hypothetical protein
MDFPPNPIQKIQTLIELLGMTLGSWTTFLWGASRNFWIGWILALAALWRQKISIPQNLLIVGTLCALLAIANMAARGQVVAFRTLCPLTLVLGVGLLRLQPLLGTRLKGLLVTGVFAGSLFASHQITARLSDAWISLSTWKKLPELCAQNARSPEIKTAFMQVPGAPDTILGWGKYSDDYAGEFSDRAIVEWAFSGVCHILAGQGPEFSGSRSQP